jgi:phosphoribosyl 1,2-cyclic phosphodiesterase
MKVIIWGSRGSLPVSENAESIKNKIYKALESAIGLDLKTKAEIESFIDTLPFSVRGSYGGNTSCVEIRDENKHILLDAGSGIRNFGNYFMKSGKIPAHFHILMSHLHWDHIQGFPFFVPAFIPGNRINFYGFHEKMEKIFIRQQESPCFPVPLEYMQAEKHFNLLSTEKEYEIAGFKIRGMGQHHPDESYAYSLEKNGKKVVYSTDSEHQTDPISSNSPFVKFFKNADILIFDAQYTLSDTLYSKKDWGHSSNVMGIELAIDSNVKHLCLFHSEPAHSDETLDKILADTKRYASIYNPSYPLKISLAYDGLEIDL